MIKTNIKLQTNFLKTLSDTHTPVELYLKLRDKDITEVRLPIGYINRC
jgi:hypothetical protein